MRMRVMSSPVCITISEPQRATPDVELWVTKLGNRGEGQTTPSFPSFSFKLHFSLFLFHSLSRPLFRRLCVCVCVCVFVCVSEFVNEQKINADHIIVWFRPFVLDQISPDWKLNWQLSQVITGVKIPCNICKIVSYSATFKLTRKIHTDSCTAWFSSYEILQGIWHNTL